ncbi:MAG: PKD domain-containing protein, partial [Bacteroidota bacterium]
MKFTHYLAFVLLAFLLPNKEVNAQITVDFNATETTGCGSLQVLFNDLSTSSAGSIVSWAWDLGGVSSSNQNPGRIFGTPGNYEICLTVTDDQGNSGSLCKTDYIIVFELPNPQFEVSQSEGCAPMMVNFIDQSISTNAQIVEWIWGVGGSSGVIVDDGSLTGISSVYNLSDDYTVSLTVKDDNGCTNTLTETDLLTVFPDPEVNIFASDTTSCTLPFVVEFTNLSSANNVNYIWNFGNGTSFNGADPGPVTYEEPGNFTVTVLAENQLTNCRDTLVLNNYITIGLPIEYLITPTEVCLGEIVRFRDFTNQIPADSVLWDFGDGNTSDSIHNNYRYEQPGCYEVSLTRFVNNCPSKVTHPVC